MPRKKYTPADQPTPAELVQTTADQMAMPQGDAHEPHHSPLDHPEALDFPQTGREVQDGLADAPRHEHTRHPEHNEEHRHATNIREAVGGTVVRLLGLNRGNREPVGVAFDFADKAERPSDDVKATLREGGFRWDAPRYQWSKRVDPEHPVKSRLEAEKTFADAVSQLRQEKSGPAL